MRKMICVLLLLILCLTFLSGDIIYSKSPDEKGYDILRIAAADSSTKSKAQADMVCTGDRDGQAINDAIKDIECGAVWFEPGVYCIWEAVRQPSHVYFYGPGAVFQAQTATTLLVNAKYNTDSHTYNDDMELGVYGITFNGGGYGVGKHGVHYTNVSGLNIHDVTVHDATGFAIRVERCERINISNIKMYSDDIGEDGLKLFESREGIIWNIYGETGDDTFSITGCNNSAYDFQVTNISGMSHHANLCLIGTSYNAQPDVTVSNVVISGLVADGGKRLLKVAGTGDASVHDVVALDIKGSGLRDGGIIVDRANDIGLYGICLLDINGSSVVVNRSTGVDMYDLAIVRS